MWTCGRSLCTALTLAITAFALCPMVCPHLAAANPVEKAFGELVERADIYVKVHVKSGNNSQQSVVPPKQSPQEGATPSLGGDAADANESNGAGNAPTDDDSAGGSEGQANGDAPAATEETGADEAEGDEEAENSGGAQA